MRHLKLCGWVCLLLAAIPLSAMIAAPPPPPPASAPAPPLAPTPATAPAIQSGAGHHFACTDYTGNKVFIVDAAGKVEWEFPAKTCNDLWVLPSGNLLFNDGKTVKEVSRDKQIVWHYDGTGEIYACQRLADGNTFVAECPTGRLLEIDPKGNVAKEVKLLPAGTSGGAAYMRNARKLDNGNYLVAHYGLEVVREYDSNAKIVWEVKAPGGPHSAVRLKNGNTLIASADSNKQPARVFEVDKDGKTVWEVKADELPGVSLKFMAGLERLDNGNTVMCNWLGHGQLGKSAHVIEVTPDKKVVWQFFDHATMKTVSSIYLLDATGQH